MVKRGYPCLASKQMFREGLKLFVSLMAIGRSFSSWQPSKYLPWRQSKMFHGSRPTFVFRDNHQNFFCVTTFKTICLMAIMKTSFWQPSPKSISGATKHMLGREARPPLDFRFAENKQCLDINNKLLNIKAVAKTLSDNGCYLKYDFVNKRTRWYPQKINLLLIKKISIKMLHINWCKRFLVVSNTLLISQILFIWNYFSDPADFWILYEEL